MGWRGGGDPPRHSVFFSREMRDVLSGVFVDVICVQEVSQYHLLMRGMRDWGEWITKGVGVIRVVGRSVCLG